MGRLIGDRRKRHLPRRYRGWKKRGSFKKGEGMEQARKRWPATRRSPRRKEETLQHETDIPSDIQGATPPATRVRIPIELHRAAIDPTTPDVLPSNLRPLPPSQEPVTDAPLRLTGNIVTDVRRCEENFNVCIREHLRMHPDCDGDVVLDPCSFSKWGMAFSGKMKCSADCGFQSRKHMKFYEEVGKPGRGRKAAKVNLQLQVVLTKHPIGNAAMRDILASIDTLTPCESAMQRTANKVCDAFRDITKEQLKKNRKFVTDVMKIRGKAETENGMPQIVAQTDVAYNNPIRGRNFYQPGTIAFAPCFVSEPGLDSIPIAFKTRSKVCSCPVKNNVKEHKDYCTMNFPANKAIGNAEYELGKDLGKELTEGDYPIGIRTLVTDGDSHLHRGMQEAMKKYGVNVQKGDCTRHITRSISRNIRKAALSDQCTGGSGRTLQDRGKIKSQLANFIERRCAWEFRALHRKHRSNLGVMVEKAKAIQIGILGCIQGYGDVCRQSSLVCGAHRKRTERKPPPGLPEGKYVKLTKSDTAVIERWMENKLGKNAILGQQDNLTTNRSECSHLTVFKGSPKCRNRLRNYDGRAMSAVHSMSIGAIDSVVAANSYLGADNVKDSPASSTRGQLRHRENYMKNMRRSQRYKNLQHAATARARRVRFAQPPPNRRSGYSTGVQHPVVRHDHTYNN